VEASAERALEIGVNLFVFIIALSCALILMTNVLNMSELANSIIKDTSGSTLMELYGETSERVYSGDEMLAIVNEYNSDITKINEKNILKVDNGGLAGAKKITKDYSFTLDELKSSYKLIYGGIETDVETNLDKEVYIFSKI